MLNNKRGASIIMLVIVIAVVCLILFFVCRVYNNTSIDASEEEAFKLGMSENFDAAI